MVGQFSLHLSTWVQTTSQVAEECIGESIGFALAHYCTWSPLHFSTSLHLVSKLSSLWPFLIERVEVG